MEHAADGGTFLFSTCLKRPVLILLPAQGSWWLSYRPIIKVELVTPSSTVAPRLEAQQSLERGHSLRRVPVPTIDVEVEPEGHAVPVYSERAG